MGLIAGYVYELSSYVRATNFIIDLLKDLVPFHRRAVTAEGERRENCKTFYAQWRH
jgi:molybdopterin synthase catalytic subunit